MLNVARERAGVPSVLVPGLNLRISKVERGREFHAVLDAKVLLPLETALQLGQLVVSEGRAGLPGLFEPDLRTVSAARDLPVPLLFHCGDQRKSGRQMKS